MTDEELDMVGAMMRRTKELESTILELKECIRDELRANSYSQDNWEMFCFEINAPKCERHGTWCHVTVEAWIVSQLKDRPVNGQSV